MPISTAPDTRPVRVHYPKWYWILLLLIISPLLTSIPVGGWISMGYMIYLLLKQVFLATQHYLLPFGSCYGEYQPMGSQQDSHADSEQMFL